MSRWFPYAAAVVGMIFLVALLARGCEEPVDDGRVAAAEARVAEALASAARSAELARADSVRAAQSAEQVAALATVNRALAQQLDASREVLVSMASTLARAQSSADDALRRSDEAPTSLVLAREGLAACSVARSACGALADSQRVVIGGLDDLVDGQAAQIRQMDTTRVYDLRQIHYQTARADTLLVAVESQREIITIHESMLRATRRQRDLARLGVVTVTVAAASLLIR